MLLWYRDGRCLIISIMIELGKWNQFSLLAMKSFYSYGKYSRRQFQRCKKKMNSIVERLAVDTEKKHLKFNTLDKKAIRLQFTTKQIIVLFVKWMLVVFLCWWQLIRWNRPNYSTLCDVNRWIGTSMSI